MKLIALTYKCSLIEAQIFIGGIKDGTDIKSKILSSGHVEWTNHFSDNDKEIIASWREIEVKFSRKKGKVGLMEISSKFAPKKFYSKIAEEY